MDIMEDVIRGIEDERQIKSKTKEFIRDYLYLY
jgi:hypothetical protein